MNVMGVSYGYHDSSACLVADGRVVAAAAEERFSRQKHDSNFPSLAVRHCLDTAALKTDQIDQIVFHEDPHAKFSRVICAALAPFPASRREFVNSMKAWLGNKLWALNTLSKRMDVPPDRISYLSHHFSHAVTAFMGSGYDRSAILVVDAVGDWACSALYSGEWKDGRPEIKRIVEVAYPNSLGLVYSAFTAWLGFNPNDSECSTMALAAFGRPIYADALHKIISDAEDTGYEVDQSYFNFQTFYKGAVTDRFIEVFGQPRPSTDPLPFSCFGAASNVSPDAQRFADAAASVQAAVEQQVLGLARRLHTAFPSENLCYAGGVALNCVANTRLLQESPFKNIFIPPDPGDGGTSVGTALYCSAVNDTARARPGRYGPYLGAALNETADVGMLDYVHVDHILPYLKKQAKDLPATQWRHRQHASNAALIDDVVQRLLRGEIIGWCQGQAEFGPRALGNRSLLIRPDDVPLAKKLSSAVKERAAFRPYALAVSAEDARNVLSFDRLDAARWMQFACPVQPAVADKVRAGLHIDDTTRAQICGAEDNALFHDLLVEFGRQFGAAALINTSFNASGYPIVNTPVEALSMFARTAMDAVVLNRTVVWKEPRA